MSALDFLSVSSAAPAGSFQPLARSAMDRRQREAGATFEEREGWLVPVSLPGESEWLESVGVADLSHLSIFEVRPSDPEIAGDDVVWYRISERRSLVLCPPDACGVGACRARRAPGARPLGRPVRPRARRP